MLSRGAAVQPAPCSAVPSRTASKLVLVVVDDGMVYAMQTMDLGPCTSEHETTLTC
jgi:hypothetical protein